MTDSLNLISQVGAYRVSSPHGEMAVLLTFSTIICQLQFRSHRSLRSLTRNFHRIYTRILAQLQLLLPISMTQILRLNRFVGEYFFLVLPLAHHFQRWTPCRLSY